MAAVTLCVVGSCLLVVRLQHRQRQWYRANSTIIREPMGPGTRFPVSAYCVSVSSLCLLSIYSVTRAEERMYIPSSGGFTCAFL